MTTRIRKPKGPWCWQEKNNLRAIRALVKSGLIQKNEGRNMLDVFRAITELISDNKKQTSAVTGVNLARRIAGYALLSYSTVQKTLSLLFDHGLIAMRQSRDPDSGRYGLLEIELLSPPQRRTANHPLAVKPAHGSTRNGSQLTLIEEDFKDVEESLTPKKDLSANENDDFSDKDATEPGNGNLPDSPSFSANENSALPDKDANEPGNGNLPDNPSFQVNEHDDFSDEEPHEPDSDALSASASHVGRGGLAKNLPENEGLSASDERMEDFAEGPVRPEELLHESFKEALAYLNRATGRRFSASDKPANWLRERLREGAGVEEIYLVIDHRKALWAKNPAMRIYLRPSTLFSRRNFWEYLEVARGWHADGRPALVRNKTGPEIETLTPDGRVKEELLEAWREQSRS